MTISNHSQGDVTMGRHILAIGGAEAERRAIFIAPFDCWVKQVQAVSETAATTAVVSVSTALGALADTFTLSGSAADEPVTMHYTDTAENNFIPAGSWVLVTSDGGGPPGTKAYYTITLGRAGLEEKGTNLGRTFFISVHSEDDDITYATSNCSFPFPVRPQSVRVHTEGIISGGAGVTVSLNANGAADVVLSDVAIASAANTVYDKDAACDFSFDIDHDVSVSLGVLGLATSGTVVTAQVGLEVRQ